MGVHQRDCPISGRSRKGRLLYFTLRRGPSRRSDCQQCHWLPHVLAGRESTRNQEHPGLLGWGPDLSFRRMHRDIVAVVLLLFFWLLSCLRATKLLRIKFTDIFFLLFLLSSVKEVNSFCHNFSPVATPAIAAANGIEILSWTFSEVQVRSLCEGNYNM